MTEFQKLIKLRNHVIDAMTLSFHEGKNSQCPELREQYLSMGNELLEMISSIEKLIQSEIKIINCRGDEM